jgi:hypothetical protein
MSACTISAPGANGHAHVLRVPVGEGAPGHQRGDHRNAGQLGQLAELGGGSRLDHAAADVEHRAAGLADQPGGLAHLAGVRPGHRVVAGQLERDWPGEVGHGLHGVLGHVHQHRARSPGRGHVEGLADGPGDVLGLGDQEVVLGDGDGDPGDVGFLEGVGADHAARHLAGDGHHRDRVHIGVGDGGDQVRRAGAAGRHADADAPGGLRVAGGRVAGPLLVPHQDVPDDLRVEQRVVGRQDGAAGDAEHHVSAHPLERVHERLRPGDPDLGRAGHLRAGGLGGRRSALGGHRSGGRPGGRRLGRMRLVRTRGRMVG